jgi:hypothetical protein
MAIMDFRGSFRFRVSLSDCLVVQSYAALYQLSTIIWLFLFLL